MNRSNRWSLAFADLTLLMLAFVVLSMVQPAATAETAAATPQIKQFTLSSTEIFDSGEAMINATGQVKAKEIAAAMTAGETKVRLAISGRPDVSARLDKWELSAARMAAFARALNAAGVDSNAIEFGEQIAGENDLIQELQVDILRVPKEAPAPDGTTLASQERN